VHEAATTVVASRYGSGASLARGAPFSFLGFRMGRYLAIAALLLFLVAVGVMALFVVQNGARTTQLSLDLGFAAWQLKEPVAVPALFGAAFGSGLLLGVVPMWIRGLARGRKLKQLERQAALSAGQSERPW